MSDTPAGTDGIDEQEGEGLEAPNPLLKLLSGGALAVAGIAAVGWAMSFGFGAFGQPGPGFWPVLLGGALLVSAVVFVVTNRDAKEELVGKDVRIAAIMLVAVIAYILLFDHVHFLVAAPLLVAGMQYLAGEKRILAIVVTSTLSTLGAWVLFFQILNVSLPL